MIHKLLNPQNKSKHRSISRVKSRTYTRTHNDRELANAFRSDSIPPPPTMEDQPPPPGSSPPKSRSNTPPQIVQSTTGTVPTLRKPSSRKGKPPYSQQQQRRTNRPNSPSPPKMSAVDEEDEKEQSKVEYNMQKYDEHFYEAIHAQKLNHPISFGSTAYDIRLVRHLSYTFWTNIKQVTMRDTIQKLTNLVMAPVNQHDERLANAIQCGVDRRQVQMLVNKLVDKTGIDVIALEELIKTRSTMQIPKAINDLDNKELEEIYGINREMLLKVKEKRVRQLKEFKKLNKKTLLKIYYIKNGNVDDLEGRDDEKLDVEDDEEELAMMYENGNKTKGGNKQRKGKTYDEDVNVSRSQDNYGYKGV